MKKQGTILATRHDFYTHMEQPGQIKPEALVRAQLSRYSDTERKIARVERKLVPREDIRE